MKTVYGFYLLYDADLQAFVPDTAAVFISDRQAIKAYAQFVAGGKLGDDFGARYRVYRLFDLPIDVVPQTAVELTPAILDLVRQLQVAKEVSNEVPDKV